MNESARLRDLLDKSTKNNDIQKIKYEEFSDLEEKYYNQLEIIEGLKSDNE